MAYTSVKLSAVLFISCLRFYYINLTMPNLKFLASTVPEIWRGSKNFKSRSRDPFEIPFDVILHFFDSADCTESVCEI